MRYELLPPEVYDNLPDDDEECFLALELICRENMNRFLRGLSPDDEEVLPVQEAYMKSLVGAAEECKIPGVQLPPLYGQNRSARVETFMSELNGALVRLRMRKRRRSDPYSVQLTPNTRSKIEHKVSLLADAIRESNLADERKAVLLGKLEELKAELANPRASFGKVMRLLGVLLVGTTTVGADSPEAFKNITAGVTSIMTFLSQDKENQEEHLRLQSPQRYLPAPSGPDEA